MNPMQTTAHETTRSRRVHRSASPWTGLLLLLPFVAFAGQDKGPFTLRMKFKAGEIHKYQTSATLGVEQAGMKYETSSVQVHKVQKILPDGGAEVEIVTTEEKAIRNGQVTGGNTPPLIVVYDAHGIMRGFKGSMPGGDMMSNLFNLGALQSQSAFLPARPVKPGDTWTQAIKLTGASSGATTKSQFLKVETIGRYRTAKIRTQITAPISLFVDAALKPTANPKQAMMKVAGMQNVTLDTNFAIADGKMIRTAGNGLLSVTAKPLAPIAPPKAGTPKSPPVRGQNPKNTAAQPPKPALQNPPTVKFNVKMQMGSNLIE